MKTGRCTWVSRYAPTVGEGKLETRTPQSCSVGGSGISIAPNTAGGVKMLYTIAAILLVAWLLGVVGTYTVGAFLHVLLVLAVILFVMGLLSGRSTAV